MTDARPQPPVAGITAAILGVSEFEPHLRLYRDQLGFAVAAEGEVPRETAQRLWNIDHSVQVQVLEAAGSPDGRIHLLRVDADVPELRPHFLDRGLEALDLYTRDLLASHRQLEAAGYRWTADPQPYVVGVGDRHVEVKEGLCLAPEAANVVLVEPANPRDTHAWNAEPSRTYTELTSLVEIVDDGDRMARFWRDGLGLDVWYDTVFSHPNLERFVHLPSGTRVRLAFVAGPHAARLEVISFPDGERRGDNRAQQRPGRVRGLCGLGLRATDLERALVAIEEHGGRVTCAPFEAVNPLHGQARVAAAETPEGDFLELWQPGA